MYNIELKNLKIENAQMEILRTTENLCDSFQVTEHFGTLSFALHEMINLMERFSDSQEDTFSINFFIDNDMISAQISGYPNVKELSLPLQNAALNDTDTTAFTIANLVDKLDFRNNNSEIWLEFHIKPQFTRIDRAELLQKEIYEHNKQTKELF